MLLRNATPNDLNVIFTINKANVPHVGDVSLEWFKKYLSLSHYFRVIEVEHKVVGFMIAMLPLTDYKSENFLWFKKNYDSFVYVDRIAIDQNYIGQGYGKKLYEDLASVSEGNTNLIACEVNTNPPNPESLAFHKKIGFNEVGILVTKNGNVTVSLLIKNLRA